LEASEKLEELNVKRRSIQDAIFEEACVQAEQLADDRVLVVSSGGWNHGVIGIVASKLVEKNKRGYMAGWPPPKVGGRFVRRSYQLMPRYRAKSAASGYLMMIPIRATSPTHTTPQNNALTPPNNKSANGNVTGSDSHNNSIVDLMRSFESA